MLLEESDLKQGIAVGLVVAAKIAAHLTIQRRQKRILALAVIMGILALFQRMSELDLPVE